MISIKPFPVALAALAVVLSCGSLAAQTAKSGAPAKTAQKGAPAAQPTKVNPKDGLV